VTTEAFINPAVLRWARQREHLTRVNAARSVGFNEERLEAWEAGTDRPTLRQAQTLAQKLGIPFGYLYLPSPPVEELPLPDLRTVADAATLAPSPELSAVLADVLAMQEWYREYLEEAGAEPITFVGRFTLAANPEPRIVADEIRERFGINGDVRQRVHSWEEFLRYFIQTSEAQGVMVLRSGVVGNNAHRKLEVAEFRGFAISDDLAPLVFINGQDAKAAQIFTLAHEIAHLWFGVSGISNPNYRALSSEQGNPVERLCNRTAAELLVPSADFSEQWQNADAIEENLQRLAARYRVSAFVVLRQAYDLKRIDGETYWTNYDALLGKTTKPQGGGGNFYATLFARNSKTMTTAIVRALAEGKILHRDAARLLNVKVSTLAGISRHVFEGA